jgi:hypothetical protein
LRENNIYEIIHIWIPDEEGINERDFDDGT